MTDGNGSTAPRPESDEVLRILGRYLIEVVERYELCPWARGAREAGELAVAVAWGTPAVDEWVTAAEALLAAPATRVAIVVAPELVATPGELGGVRDRVAARLPAAGVADFHPDAQLDLSTPARLVRFLRRSPDRMLQFVPLALLDRVRTAPAPSDRAQQAAMLGGRTSPPPPPLDIAERIAMQNHATAVRAHAEIAATLDAIAMDRRAAYLRAGIIEVDLRV